MSKRLHVLKTCKLYIGGKFSRSESEHYFQVMDKKNEPLANVCRASRKDLRNAVQSARKALSGWSGRSAYNRGQILYRMAEMLEGRREQFTGELETAALTKELAKKETDTAIDRLVYYAGWTDKYSALFSSVNPVASPYFNFSIPEATGVVGALAPDNHPLSGPVSLIAPLIAGGNTCVLLASEKSGSLACTLAEVLHSSDVPAGVVNILTGYRSDIVPHLATHMDVNAIMCAADDPEQKKNIQKSAHCNVKRVHFYDGTDWLADESESPYYIMDFQEIKTTWHPVGI